MINLFCSFFKTKAVVFKTVVEKYMIDEDHVFMLNSQLFSSQFQDKKFSV